MQLVQTDPSCSQLSSQLALSSLAAPTEASSHATDKLRPEDASVRAVVACLSFSARQMQQVCDLATPSRPRVHVIQALYSGTDQAIADFLGDCVNCLRLDHLSTVLSSRLATPGPVSDWSLHDAVLMQADAALDQTAFLLQAIERYLRLISSFLLLGNVGQPSSMQGSVSKAAQALMGQFVRCEQAFVAAQISSSFFTSQPVKVQVGVYVDSWVDTTFYVLRQSVSRCASTYSTMTAAAALNHMVGLLEDHIQPAFRSLLALCVHSHHDPLPAVQWLRHSNAPGAAEHCGAAAAAEEKQANGHADGQHGSGLSAHAVRSLNSASLVVSFTTQLSAVVGNELRDIFSSKQTAGGDGSCSLEPLLALGVKQLEEAAGTCEAWWSTQLEATVEHLLRSPVSEFVRALQSSSFVIPSDQYDGVLAKHGLFRFFETAVLEAAGLDDLVLHMSNDAKSSLGKAIALKLDTILSHFTLNIKCNELGGMYMNRLLADIRAAMQQRGMGKGVRSSFIRTSQCVSILCSSSVADACQLFFAIPSLQAAEVRQLLHNRADFFASDVEKADLHALNLISPN